MATPRVMVIVLKMFGFVVMLWMGMYKSEKILMRRCRKQADGSCVEQKVAISPGWQEKLVGYPTVPLGEDGLIEALDAQVICIDEDNLEPDQAESLPVNAHELPAPMEDDGEEVDALPHASDMSGEEARGDMIIWRRNDVGCPSDITIDEWKEYCLNPKAPKFLQAIDARRMRKEDNENEDEDDDDEDDDVDDDNDSENGRLNTEQLASKTCEEESEDGASDDDDDDDDDDDEEEEEEEEEQAISADNVEDGDTHAMVPLIDCGSDSVSWF
ncbi:hypothetical protein GUITHDRAFT_145678 [Guillardia theta CCMP2712]|uniref:Uncharacterized protein n=1 Tax=Guillardia theta (strain CCMP2712) TaxID=905079 RepID=L1IK69_GUITC|nr:hypothetical protein GUITHDRAFT_145678 [Guillardia theta CCMP2712]EKX36512.1 hypothetical protein GUITHDRAFT_145678 [Guillardia theta CCMP2712]|eukprot:XP_005823492.1 hypothetical protein GUITHDRAFT_145678 [Guillardia theta CCMP2712]